MAYIDGITVYRGLGNRPYRPNTPVRRIPSSITVNKGLGGHPATTSGQVGHDLGGMFRSLSKAVSLLLRVSLQELPRKELQNY